jgi:plastocyanin domain-containing protein
MKLKALEQGLIRKGLITEEGALTTIGVELLVFLDSKEEKKFVKKKSSTTDFEQWYKEFPGTDTFTHKGKTFSGSRTLRQNPIDCRLKFDKILLEGEYTATQLIAALNFEITQKKENSITTNSNRLTFMQGSSVYLNQRSFEPFIELINEGAKVDIAPQKPTGGTDI